MKTKRIHYLLYIHKEIILTMYKQYERGSLMNPIALLGSVRNLRTQIKMYDMYIKTTMRGEC